jgi:hypothetical protein
LYLYPQLKAVLFVDLFVIITILLFSSGNFGHSYSTNSTNTNIETNNPKPFIHVETNKPKYLRDEVVRIFGYVDDGHRVNGKVTTHISDGSKVVDNESIYTTKNGTFRLNFTDTHNPGDYKITASINDSQDSSNVTSIHIMDLWATPMVQILLLGSMSSAIGLFVLLLVTSKYKKEKKGESEFEIAEILRFMCISGIALSPILAYFLSDMELGTASPIGLTMRQPLDQSGKPQSDTKGQIISYWIIHVGGTSANNYATGLNIPFYVVMFGTLGGYLRYLHKAARKEHDYFYKIEIKCEKCGEKIKPDYTSSLFIHDTLGELSHVLLSPLLAIAVWFILSQGDTSTNVYILAVVSFAVGLITEEVIHGIVTFVQGRLKETDKSKHT